MKKFFNISVPFWEVLLLLIGMSIGMFIMFSLFREQVLNYILSLPAAVQKTDTPLSYGEQPALSDPDFFQKIKNEFILQKASFVEADLSQMKLSLYKEGVLIKEVPILTKGKEGSWWETPAGIYKIQNKEENHFSTFGHVYQPWSMAFQGNFFIHGWPYYSDGTLVASVYSGGCIRLSTTDAESIFSLARVGMPVLVFKDDFVSDNFRYGFHIPDISATDYIAADIQNNFVFLEKNKTALIPTGPFSQIVGALVATDYINIEKNITLNNGLLSGVVGQRYYNGEKVTPFDLLHPLLLESDPQALKIFSNYLEESRFSALVNDKAKAVGMSHSQLNSSDPETTPEDLFYLAKYLYGNRKFILDLSAGHQTNTSYTTSRFGDLPNRNIFSEDKNFIGGKAVTNEDGTQSFFGVFEISVNGQRRPIFIFLNNSNDVTREIPEIKEYIQNSYI